MLRQHKGSLLRAERQGEATMKQQKAILIAAIIIITAAVAAILVMREDLCEVRIRTGQTEVAVFMDYEPR